MSDEKLSPPELLSVQETARLLGVSTNTLRNWRATFPAVKAFGKTAYRRCDVEAFVACLQPETQP